MEQRIKHAILALYCAAVIRYYVIREELEGIRSDFAESVRRLQR